MVKQVVARTLVELAKPNLEALGVAKRNPPGFFGSEDERALEEAGWREFIRRGEHTSPE